MSAPKWTPPINGWQYRIVRDRYMRGYVRVYLRDEFDLCSFDDGETWEVSVHGDNWKIDVEGTLEFCCSMLGYALGRAGT